ncbi:hypothetical protein COCMIDRAFT_94642 [Bipolaris oryzae ATCC 44560]|uniref:Uncharacterized protein n=1 Tax=Bipolaris oryzae ATCC 44560 TaxID=930090 RepID=W6Z1W3_COCMI|nr:uncharacterized protein COCMIDRAFT_94642 [Bipolaris oryzae ATCC 44560]EUC45732.1 hypothetical protein COCMIDRAFT_94642 [Bipolaris oryzae ATCC 44560]
MVGNPPSALSNLPTLHSLHNEPLLRELAVTQALASSLSRDCEKWRTLVEKHSSALEEANKTITAANKKLKDREHIISKLKKGNASLKTQGDTSSTLATSLASTLKETTTSLDSTNKKLEDATAKHDSLALQLQEAKANMTKLRRSDRNKEKTQQQNLHLKALLHRQCAARYNSNNSNDNNTAATLRTAPTTTTATTTRNEDILHSALSAALERIDELETSAHALLDALDEHGDSSNEEEDDEGEHDEADATAKLLEAQVKMDGVLRDRGFAVKKGEWGHLIRD